MKKIIILICVLAMSIWGTGCTAEESIEIGAWRDKLEDGYAAEESREMDMASEEMEEEGESSLFGNGLLSMAEEFGQQMWDGGGLLKEMAGQTDTAAGEENNQCGYEENGLYRSSFIRVIDGDTIQVMYENQESSVRLIGINTPESVHPEAEKNTEAGKAAADYLREKLAETETVWLEFDEQQTDTYGRLLAYVWLEPDTADVSKMLNVQLLEEGMAEVMTVEPNIRYKAVFESR